MEWWEEGIGCVAIPGSCYIITNELKQIHNDKRYVLWYRFLKQINKSSVLLPQSVYWNTRCRSWRTGSWHTPPIPSRTPSPPAPAATQGSACSWRRAGRWGWGSRLSQSSPSGEIPDEKRATRRCPDHCCCHSCCRVRIFVNPELLSTIINYCNYFLQMLDHIHKIQPNAIWLVMDICWYHKMWSCTPH